MSVEDFLADLDRTLHDVSVSPDAMRWMPEPVPEPPDRKRPAPESLIEAHQWYQQLVAAHLGQQVDRDRLAEDLGQLRMDQVRLGVSPWSIRGVRYYQSGRWIDEDLAIRRDRITQLTFEAVNEATMRIVRGGE